MARRLRTLGMAMAVVALAMVGFAVGSEARVAPASPATLAPQQVQSPRPQPTQKPKSTQGPVERPTPTPTAAPRSTPKPAPLPTATPATTLQPATASPSATAIAAGAVVDPGGGSTPEATAGLGDAPGVSGAPFALALAGGAAIAFVAIARRRRAVRVQPAGVGPAGEAGVDTSAEAIVPPAPSPGAADEAHIPRWRRPSLAAARFTTDATAALRAAAAVSMAPARPPLTFTTEVDAPAERLYVRYDAVLLLNRPDEALGRTLAELDAGDEVDVVERDGAWARVMTPLGIAGWVPGMAVSATRQAFVESAPQLAPEGQSDPRPPADERPLLDTLIEAVVAARQAHGEPAERSGGPVASSRPRTRRRPPQSTSAGPAPSPKPAASRSPARRGPAARGA